MTQIKIIFSDNKVQMFHNLKEGRDQVTDSIVDKAAKQDPLSYFSYKVKIDTILCNYLSTAADSLCFHKTIFKLYKKSNDTLVMMDSPTRFEIKLVRDK